MTFLGYIYSLNNNTTNTCYIGSTTYKNPNSRYSHHISQRWSCTRKNYPELFENGNPTFTILHKGDYMDRKDLREKENDYIKTYNPKLTIVNKYNAYSSPETLKEQKKRAKKKYEQTWKGKQGKIWGQYRTRMRKKLLLELHNKVPLVH